MTRSRVPILYLSLNVALAAAYIGVASISWTEPEVRDIPGASGGAPFVWALTAVPIFLLAVLVNVGVPMWAWHRGSLRTIGKLAWGALALWAGVLVFDNLHH